MMEAKTEKTEALKRLKAVAQANIQTARDIGSTPGISQQFYRGRAGAFEEMIRAIEALESDPWEKKARELLSRMPGNCINSVSDYWKVGK